MTHLNTLSKPASALKMQKQAKEKNVAIFDLYGTLIDLDTRPLLRKLSKYLGVRATPDLLRQSMTVKFPEELSAVQGFIEILLGREATTEEITHCKGLVDEHLAKAELIEGATLLLTFLRRRGMKIALLSNVSQIFKKPFYDLGLHQYFDVVHFSSDTGFRKPEDGAYLGVCQALKVDPKDCMFFGDDAKNDYDGPLMLGMRPVHIGPAPRAESVPKLTDLLWLSQTAEPLLKLDQKIRTDSGYFIVDAIEQLNPTDLGMYNIVARVHGEDQDGKPVTWYAKRFLDVSSVHVEQLAHELYANIGVNVPRAFLSMGSEPVLFTSPAKGRIWQNGDFDASIAEQLGAQAAAAYIVSNADWRPRNTFVCKDTATLTGIDLEHCLFDRVLSLAQTGMDVNDPKEVDSLGIRTSVYTRTRVLSDGAIRRARRCFTQNADRKSKEIQLYLKGWENTFSIAAENKQAIANLIRKRMDSGQLIVGTNSHRRAFASVDLHDLLERIELGKPVMFNDDTWSTN